MTASKNLIGGLKNLIKMVFWTNLRSRVKKGRRWVKIIIAPYIVKTAFWIVYHCCREVRIVGAYRLDRLLASGKPFLPCYWHRQGLFCSYYLLQQQNRGLKLGFLVSPSVDGDIGADIIESAGARSIRGSSSGTGAQALKHLYFAVKKKGVSITTTPDGPRGPIFEFKPGVIILARLTGAPILPIAYATDRAWTLNSWDRFFIPKPLSKVVIMIGEPVKIPSRLTEDETKKHQAQMADALNRLSTAAAHDLEAKTA